MDKDYREYAQPDDFIRLSEEVIFHSLEDFSKRFSCYPSLSRPISLYQPYVFFDGFFIKYSTSKQARRHREHLVIAFSSAD